MKVHVPLSDRVVRLRGVEADGLVEALARVRESFDDTVCLYTPEPYYAVGQWYVDFHQVSDDEVRRLMGTT